MAKTNCWEHKKCGRERGGPKAAELGVCPAASETRVDGVNDGKNGGRACWAIAGTLCGGTVQGTFARKLGSCMQCDFHKFILAEEKGSLEKTKDILSMLK